MDETSEAATVPSEEKTEELVTEEDEKEADAVAPESKNEESPETVENVAVEVSTNEPSTEKALTPKTKDVLPQDKENEENKIKSPKTEVATKKRTSPRTKQPAENKKVKTL